MKKIIRLTESDLTKIVKRVINEDSSDKSGSLYSKINKLIDGEFSDMEPSEIQDILNRIAKSHGANAERKKKGKEYITKDEVIKNFRKK
jgi:hypothetical protein